MHSTAQRLDLHGVGEPPLEVTVEFDIRRGGWQPAPVSPLAILASHGRVGSQRALKAANALEGAIGTYGCAVALNQIGCRALSRMGRLDDYRRFAKECLDMANAVQDATSRLLVANGTGMVALGTGARCQEALRSGLRIRVFQISLLRKFLPSPGHFLQNPLLLLGFCLLRQTAAFLREALVLG